MAEDNMTLRQWQIRYKNGEFNNPGRYTMCKAGWYDWFCNDSSLKNRLDKMAKIIIQIKDKKDGGRVDLDNTYVWFKNNCPLAYPLYDDFRISDIYTGKNLFVVDMPSDYTRKTQKAGYVVYSLENDYRKPIFVCNDLRVLVKWFNNEV